MSDHEFQADGPGVIGSDLCQVCGKERYEHMDELPSLKQMCALMALHRAASGYHDLKPKWDEAINEANCCDDINLDQPLAGIIADLQKDREELHRMVRDAMGWFLLTRETLESIAKNTCCDGCQEAALVAQSCLDKLDHSPCERCGGYGWVGRASDMNGIVDPEMCPACGGEATPDV